MPRTLLLAAALACFATDAHADLFWIEAGEDAIQRSNQDGSSTVTLASFEMVDAKYPAINSAAQKIYWGDATIDRIYRANLDGTGVELLLETLDPLHIALDPANGTMYWTSRNAGTLSKAALDGSGEVTIHTGLREPQGIAVDPVNERIFWNDSMDEAILYSDFDGGNLDTLVTELLDPIGLAIDPGAGVLFWTESTADRVSRIDVDGQNRVTLAGPKTTSFFNLRGIAVDTVNGRLFFTTDSILGRMFRMNVDGSDRTLVIKDQPFGPVGVAADPSTGHFYWWHDGARSFYRTDPLAGDKVLTLTGMLSPNGLVLDSDSGTVYWSDHTNLFQVGDDGTGMARVPVNFPGAAAGIAHDAGAGKLYWTADQSVHRANTDGSAFETISGGCEMQNPKAIVVDEVNGKVYWTKTTGILQRSNLDGSGCEDLVIPELSQATALAIDADAGLLYIGDDGNNQLLRYNIATTVVDPLVTSASSIFGISLEPVEGKMYWSQDFFQLKRADLDGSNVETIGPSVNGPWGIVATPGTTPTTSTSWSRLKGRF